MAYRLHALSLLAGALATVAGCEGGIITLLDPPRVDGGSPGSPDLAAPVPAKPPVLSEIMYHPVAENAADDNHEFIEIHNPGDAALDLSGWSISGEVDY